MMRSEASHNKIRKLSSELEELLNKEEMMWRQIQKISMLRLRVDKGQIILWVFVMSHVCGARMIKRLKESLLIIFFIFSLQEIHPWITSKQFYQLWNQESVMR
ncbi:hypothetical protein ACP275_11G090000 [Erythranthe tilingii]